MSKLREEKMSLQTTSEGKVKAQTEENWTEKQRRKTQLKDTAIKEKFELMLTNRFQALQKLHEEDCSELETQWRSYKKAVIRACEEVIGRRTSHQKDWMSAETYKKIQDRNNKKVVFNNSHTTATKAKPQEVYSEANREEKKSE